MPCSEQMSLKADRFLPLSPGHTCKGDAVKGVFHSRKYMQPSCTHLPFRSLYADSFVTSLPENGKDRGNAATKWPTLLGLSSEGSEFSDDLRKENSLNSAAAGHNEQRRRSIDVTTFGNLCVDIVLNVPTLPPDSFEEKLAYMKNLAKSSPDEKFWEAGGNSNFAIAAARLGLQCAALGHIGREKYGSFLYEILEKEGVQVIPLEKENIQEETLLCWVLVDPDHRHGFCSRFDFNKDPAFKWIKELPVCAKEVIQKSKVLFFNGFVFDEITPEMITSTVDFANKTGCVVFFDPGPRGQSLFKGPANQQHALQKLLSFSDVLLLTADEAEALTGLDDPVLSAKELLARGQCTKWVIVKMGDKGCLMTTAHGVYQCPAFKVDVKDTVGCGDSFAAAIALGYTRGLPIVSTLALANAVGAATAMGCGAGRNVATLEEVKNILLRSKLSDDCDLNGKVQTFSTAEQRKVGTSQLDKQASLSDRAYKNMPFHIITREAVNLLINSAQSSGST
eukprot:c23270_g1_i1 orf=701-2221(+)